MNLPAMMMSDGRGGVVGIALPKYGRRTTIAYDLKRTFLLRAIRKRSLPVIGSRGYLLPALRHWTDASDINTIAVVGLPSGQHKVLIELADPMHQVFAGCACAATVTFTVPGSMTSHEGPGRN